MNLILIPSLLFMLITNIMMMLAFILSKKSFNEIEKLSPFECGFDPISNPRLPFSLHFFLITIIFVIFDIEITILFPLVTSTEITNYNNWSLITIMFLIILLMGLYYEWNMGMLNWNK
uniref:NADH dehydrogenase subunit 3 n=1 Tax=Uenoa lobata TaxID=1958741 RepID=UPI0022DCDCAF|nr:NADH dehydrogenase subunit 3 [Uenoa lobata]UZZ44448.1 NADH dehydrogenase subunit 3 [Uenoa lobata]